MNSKILSFLFALIVFTACSAQNGEEGGNPKLAEADELRASQQFEEAKKLYTSIIQEDNQVKMAWTGRGVSRWYLKDFNGALSDLAKAIDMGKENKYNDRKDLPKFRGEDYFYLGMTYYDLRDYVKARQAFDRAIEEGFDVADSYSEKALTYAAEQDFPMAIMQFGEAIKADPNHVFALSNRAYYASSAGDYRTADKDFARALELAPDQVRTWINRGYMYIEREMYPQALADFDKALALDPENVEARTFKGVCFSDMGAPDRAIPEFDKVLAKIPDNGKVNYYKGHALLVKGDITEGCVFINRAVELGNGEAMGDQDAYCK